LPAYLAAWYFLFQDKNVVITHTEKEKGCLFWGSLDLIVFQVKIILY